MKEFTLEKLRRHPDYDRLYNEQKQILDIAIMIAEMREKRHLTQEDLAQKIGSSQSVVSRIERGIENITLKKLFKIAKALGAHVKISLRY